MRKTVTLRVMATACAAMLCVVAQPLSAQESRLQDRVPEAARASINAILDSAVTQGIPTEPLVDRALEGASKGAGADLILRAVRRLAGELVAARDALGDGSSEPEIVAGASALRAGANPNDLSQLRVLRAELSLTIPAAVLADLVAVGVPADTAAAAVIALAAAAADAEYIAFRQNVERDITLGVSPATALGVRLEAAADYLDASAPTTARANEGTTIPGGQRRPRKP